MAVRHKAKNKQTKKKQFSLQPTTPENQGNKTDSAMKTKKKKVASLFVTYLVATSVTWTLSGEGKI